MGSYAKRLCVLGATLGICVGAVADVSIEDIVRGNEAAVATLTGIREANGETVQSSGCYIAPGYILSTAHQAIGVRDLRARFLDGGEYPVQLAASDVSKEIALLRVEQALPHAALIGDARRLRGGSLLVAIAAPANLEATVVTGIVSSTNRSYRGYPVIQADMRAAPGSSGGPVFDRSGALAGLIIGRLEEESWVTVVNPVNNAYNLLRGNGVAVPEDNALVDNPRPATENEEALTPEQGISLREQRAVDAYNQGVAAKRWEDKTAAYAMAATLIPEFYEAWFNLGVVEASQGNLSAAEAAYRRASKLRPDAYAPCRNLGRLFLDMGNAAEASRCFQEALRLAPGMPQSHNDLGEARRRGGQFTEAVEAFERALRLDPQYARSHYNLGLTHAQLGNHDAAVAHFRQYLELTPGAEDHETVKAWIAELTP